MMCIKEMLQKSEEYLARKKISNARRQAQEVISDCLGLSRLELYIHHDRPLNEQEVNACRGALTRRGKGEPAQYIRGAVDFLGCVFAVNQCVLIPRQETEILADQIVNVLKAKDLENKELWDLCSGSGCLGIALKKRLPLLKVVLSDISGEALQVARHNAEKNQVEVEIIKGDLLDPFKGRKAHFVVCNPPYISENEYEELDKEVKDFEPKGALLGGRDGLEFYRRLSQELPFHLHPGAGVWLEIGSGQGQKVCTLFAGSFWEGATFQSDWAGHDRFFSVKGAK